MAWRLVSLAGLVLTALVVFALGGYDDAGNRPVAVAGLALYLVGAVGGFLSSRRVAGRG